MINLLGLDFTEMSKLLSSWGQPAYRAQQIITWIHKRGVTDFTQMTDLSKSLRTQIQENTHIQAPKILQESLSRDGTRKWLMSLPSGGIIETVFIPEARRGTLCISSQVGCALNCTFCSTARQGFERNCSSADIIGQVFLAKQQLSLSDEHITNVVLMGMGEPLLNLAAVLPALTLMRSDHAYQLPRRRVTVSTSGVVPGILQLADKADVSLALSLHAGYDELRNKLVPLNKKYPLSEVLAACMKYCEKNSRHFVTMEYVMLNNVNDSKEDANKLIKLLRNIPCKINLIPFNPFAGVEFTCSSKIKIKQFAEVLQAAGFVVTTRVTRGLDIDAACGQLRGKVIDKTNRQQRYAQATSHNTIADPLAALVVV